MHFLGWILKGSLVGSAICIGLAVLTSGLSFFTRLGDIGGAVAIGVAIGSFLGACAYFLEGSSSHEAPFPPPPGNRQPSGCCVLLGACMGVGARATLIFSILTRLA